MKVVEIIQAKPMLFEIGVLGTTIDFGLSINIWFIHSLRKVLKNYRTQRMTNQSSQTYMTTQLNTTFL
jgi:hypothetical protein